MRIRSPSSPGVAPPTPARPATAAEPTPQRRPPDAFGAEPSAPVAAETPAERVATELFRAMLGGVWGIGTDEHGLLQVLTDSAGGLAEVRSAYRHHYGRDLDADLLAELSGADRARALSLLSGQEDDAAAHALAQAMKGVGTDEATLFAVLEQQVVKGRLAAVSGAYERQAGVTLPAALDGELSGDDARRATSLLSGDLAGANAAGVHRALAAGEGDAAVLPLLDLPGVAHAYLRDFGADLNEALERALPAASLAVARALLTSDPVKVVAARLWSALQGGHSVHRALEGTASAGTRGDVETAFRALAGSGVEEALRGALSGKPLERALAWWKDGGLTPAQRVHYAISGAGTDESELERVLAGLTRAELDAIRADYLGRFGENLDVAVLSELGGADAFEVGRLLEGAPETLDALVAQAKARRDFERSGLANAVGAAVMDVVLWSKQGKRLDDTAQRAQGELADAKADGVVTPAEQAKVAQLARATQRDAGTYAAARHRVAETAGHVATTLGTTAAVALTGGAGGLVTALALSAAGGAVGRTAATAAIQGKSYSELVEDVTLGAVSGLGTVAGALVAEAATRAALLKTAGLFLEAWKVPVAARTAEVLELTAHWLANASPGARSIVAGVESAVADGVGSGLAEAAHAATRGMTWENGLPKGLARTALAGLKGMGSGLVTGAALGAAMGATRAMLHLPLFNAEGHASQWHKVTVRVDGAEKTINVLGPVTAPALDELQATLQRMATLTDGRAIESLSNVYLIPLGSFDNPVVGTFGVSGRAGIGDFVLIDPGFAAVPGAMWATVPHELGHNVDLHRRLVPLTSLSGAAGSPFGKGAGISTYAATDHWEDFAEAHSFLINNWDSVLSGAALQGLQPDTAAKVKYVLEHAYPDAKPSLR